MDCNTGDMPDAAACVWWNGCSAYRLVYLYYGGGVVAWVGGCDSMILCIIQARMSSTRLPGKVLKDLAGKPMLQWVIDAAVDSKLLDGVVVATSTMASDLPIVEYCYKRKIYCTTGPLDDVLARFYQTAVEWRPTHIVRLTADCPLLTGGIIDWVIERYLSYNWIYGYNAIDGLDVEIFPYIELLKAHKTADFIVADREHVTPAIKAAAGDGATQFLFHRAGVALQDVFSVNTPEEFDRMENILSGLQSYVVKTRNGGRGI